MRPALFHHTWTERRRSEPVEETMRSPLLQLHSTSEVDPLAPEQIRSAREVLALKDTVVQQDGPWDEVHRAQRRVVEAYLAGRRRFPAAEHSPFEEAAAFAAEGRDIFLVVKFMDEAPHIDATFRSLLQQKEVDLGRVVIVAADNNSTDGSAEIVQRISAENPGPARIIYFNQDRPGAGHTARMGVDRCLATIMRMCELDGDWSRLQSAVIAVSDGDTVYHPHVLHEIQRILAESPTVDGVMPFLTYKLTAALRLFPGHLPASPERLAEAAATEAAVTVPVDLSTECATDEIPRQSRRLVGDRMRIAIRGHDDIDVDLRHRDEHGRRFGVLRDAAGRRAYLLEDRTLVLAEAPVSGTDAALTALENGLVTSRDKWRWHAVIGHDIFLSWLFEGMGMPEEMIYPDTSDALKTFRAWAFAIGGQHQLSRPGLRIVTGSDYQTGRVLQATGCTVRLGSASACAQTETDRLIKMARNLMRKQAVFYGQTRASLIERASGLYVHMTRIQGDIEDEVRRYADEDFEHTVFPERVIFPLRWMFQNALRFYSHDEPEARDMVREGFLRVFFGERADEVEERWFTAETVSKIRRASHDERPDVAERVAEDIIADTYPQIMACYGRTLRDFFEHHQVRADAYEWLLDGVESSRNALREDPPEVDPAAVWEGREFTIDIARGQAVKMVSSGEPAQ